MPANRQPSTTNRIRVAFPRVVAILIALGICAPAHAQYEAPPFDSIHLAVPEISQARDWYLKYMGGNVGETVDRIAFGEWTGDHPLPVQLIFEVSANAKPSAGSVLDSIGFSFSNLDETVNELKAAGVKIVMPVTDDPTYWKHAVVEDPWGTKLELVQDPELIGLHHVTLHVPDPQKSMAWYLRAFGGDRATIRGVEAIRYRDLGLIYLFAVKGEGTPSEGHSLAGLGWGPIDLDKVVNDLKTIGVEFSSDTNPRGNPACNFVGGDGEEGGPRTVRRLFCAQPDQLPHRIVHLITPDGLSVELVQHLEAGGH